MDCDTRVVRHSADDEKDKYVVIFKGNASIDGQIVEVEVKLTARTDLLINSWPRGTMSNVRLGPTAQKKLAQQ
jgi:hypothetical protein